MLKQNFNNRRIEHSLAFMKVGEMDKKNYKIHDQLFENSQKFNNSHEQAKNRLILLNIFSIKNILRPASTLIVIFLDSDFFIMILHHLLTFTSVTK